MCITNLGRQWRWAAIACLAAAAVGACGGDSKKTESASTAPDTNVVQPGAPGEPSRELSAEDLARLETPKHTKADVEFMQEMIHHHGQAILMTNWVDRRTASQDIPLLAERMRISQKSETELMQRWLKDRGVKPRDPRDHRGHDHGSGKNLPPGMLTVDQLGRLFTAKGRAFDRLFLRYMTYHHRGALVMVSQLRSQNGGAEPELDAFTRHVEADQGIEIARMQDLLAEFR
jgi:uncharacterized protein (DUF305 family)